MRNCSPEAIDRLPESQQPEDVRNALLRRADWRFLLPMPSPRSSVCFMAGALSDAVRAISGACEGPAGGARSGCDLAAAADPDAATLHEAFARLRPGGSCYVEYTGARARGSAARGSMIAAGFHEVRVYWPWPSADACQVWLPADDLRATAAYLRLRGRTNNGPLRGIRQRGRLLTALGRQALGLTGHLSVIGSKPGSSGGQTVFDELLRCWNEFDLGPEPERLSPVLQTAGRRSLNKVVAFLFGRDGRRLAAVVKIARLEDASAGLRREAQVLETVRGIPGVPAGIPRVLMTWPAAAPLAICETGMSGTPMSVGATDSQYAMTTTAATRWLTDLAAASRTSGDGWSETVRTALHDFTMTFGRAVGRELPAAIHRGLATTPPMPTVCEHRDFAPWNLLVHGDKTLSVLDWESSVTCGVPALDLIYFLTYLAFAKQKITAPAASALPAYRAAWSESTAVGRVNHACVRTYMSALGLDPAALPSLRLLTWLVHTRSEYRHLRADCGGGVPSDRSLRDSLFFTLMKEDLRERPAFALEP